MAEHECGSSRWMDAPCLTLLFVSEKEDGVECCVGLFRGISRIRKLLKSLGRLEDHYLEWEEITSREPGLQDAAEGEMVHLVLQVALTDPGPPDRSITGRPMTP